MLLNRHMVIVFLAATLLFVHPLVIAERSGYSSAGDLIDVSGTIVSTSADSFYLDYGEGLILVEMEGWQWYEQRRSQIDGDDVTVYGRMDEELLSREVIRASSIFVEDLNTFYYSSRGDKEFNPRAITYSLPVVSRGHQMNITGTVENIEGRQFTLETGIGSVRVDTSKMIYNPLDDIGYQIIQPGDRVAVASRLQRGFFSAREVDAEAIISLVFEDIKSGE